MIVKAQLTFLILILLLSLPSWAQELKPLVKVDSLSSAQQKVFEASIDSVKSAAFKIDSLKQVGYKKYDSIGAALSASTHASAMVRVRTNRRIVNMNLKNGNKYIRV